MSALDYNVQTLQALENAREALEVECARLVLVRAALAQLLATLEATSTHFDSRLDGALTTAYAALTQTDPGGAHVAR